jgi:hypothetical protein
LITSRGIRSAILPLADLMPPVSFVSQCWTVIS